LPPLKSATNECDPESPVCFAQPYQRIKIKLGLQWLSRCIVMVMLHSSWDWLNRSVYNQPLSILTHPCVILESLCRMALHFDESVILYRTRNFKDADRICYASLVLGLAKSIRLRSALKIVTLSCKSCDTLLKVLDITPCVALPNYDESVYSIRRHMNQGSHFDPFQCAPILLIAPSHLPACFITL
jgi:hypothetical protein